MHKNFAKDQDSVIKQPICKSYENISTHEIFYTVFLNQKYGNTLNHAQQAGVDSWDFYQTYACWRNSMN